MRKTSAVLLVCLLMITSFAATAYAGGIIAPDLSYSAGTVNGTMYVYTEDGKTLNVRKTNQVGNNIIGRLAYGSPVTVRNMYNGWAEITYSWVNQYGVVSNYAYVQSRYLVRYRPSPKSTGGNAGNPAYPGSSVKDNNKEINNMNAEFRSARKVSPFIVVSRPARVSGWVNLRWAPSLEAERISTCPQGKELIVLSELNNWYQVQDPVSGMIGFISRQYVSVR